MRPPLPVVSALLALACVGDRSEAPGADSASADADTGPTSASADTDGTSDTDSAPADTSGATALPEALVVVTLNLHCFKLEGTAFDSDSARWAAIAQELRDRQVDVLAVQEACVSESRGDALAQLEGALNEATGEPWSRAWVSAHRAWEGSEDEAEEGLGLLVRTDQPLEAASLEYAVQGALRRVALHARLPGSLGGLSVYTVHLDYERASARAAQARETAVHAILETLPELDALIAGDLNGVAGGDAHGAFTGAGYRDLSAELDPGRIDHLLLHRGAPWRLVEAALLFDGVEGPVVSDHPGVLARLEPGEGEPVTTTRLVAEVDAGWGSWLSVRGDAAPLDWEAGWPARGTGDARWEFATTEWDSGEVAYKWLLNDETWQTGDDLRVGAGAEQSTSPTF